LFHHYLICLGPNTTFKDEGEDNLLRWRFDRRVLDMEIVVERIVDDFVRPSREASSVPNEMLIP
jgi:hypothetical protein